MTICQKAKLEFLKYYQQVNSSSFDWVKSVDEEGFRIICGTTRRCLLIEGKNFVIKWDLPSYYECFKETIIYQRLCDRNEEDLVAKYYGSFTFRGKTFYVYERLTPMKQYCQGLPDEESDELDRDYFRLSNLFGDIYHVYDLPDFNFGVDEYGKLKVLDYSR